MRTTTSTCGKVEQVKVESSKVSRTQNSDSTHKQVAFRVWECQQDLCAQTKGAVKSVHKKWQVRFRLATDERRTVLCWCVRFNLQPVVRARAQLAAALTHTCALAWWLLIVMRRWMRRNCRELEMQQTDNATMRVVIYKP